MSELKIDRQFYIAVIMYWKENSTKKMKYRRDLVKIWK